MTGGVVTVKEGVGADEARRILHQHRIEKLVVVDDAYRCIGLVTVKDMEKAARHPDAAKDDKGRLRVAAATGVGPQGIARAEALFDAEVDVRSEEHTSELQSLMRISYAVFCLKKKNKQNKIVNVDRTELTQTKP